MLNTSGLLYLGSRAVSAAGNLLAVAIFTRLAGPAEYGHYVLIFAWSMIVYGFAAQWMRFAYFGVYQSQQVPEYVASLVQLLGVAMAGLAAVFGAMALSGLFDPLFLFAIFTLICGMTVYEAAFEITRTLLDARSASLSMILRTCLTVVFGSVTLWLGGGSTGLAFAIAFANLVAAIPCLATFADVRLSQSSRAASLRMLQYGWPLLLSFGVTAVGQSIDRLLLEHYAGTAALGPYGVVADVLRQSFTVFGEAVVLALITVAKQHANDGDRHASDRTLQKAFNACLTAAAFGTAFFFVFGEPILKILLGREFISDSQGLISIFAIAFAFMTMRNYYFAQVIYFTQASHLEFIVSALFLIVSTTLSLLLIPAHGTHGAAISLMTASVVACLAFVVIGRRRYRMPIDPAGLGAIPLLAALFVLGARGIAQVVADAAVLWTFDAVIFVLFSGFAIYRFRLLLSTGETGRTRLATAPAADLAAAASIADGRRPPHDEFLGLPFCLLTAAQSVDLIVRRSAQPYGYVVTPNAYHVVSVREHPDLLPVYRDAFMSLCDSQIIRGLAATERKYLPHVTGSDLVAALLASQNAPVPASERKRLLVVGPDRSAERALRARYPQLDVEVLPAPSGLAQSPELRLQVAQACTGRTWDILLLCVGCPAQELIASHIGKLGRRSGIALCVGAAVDFVIGRRARAPKLLQRLGLEWAYRLLSEPARLWRRYLVESPKIFGIFLAARLARRP
jgi:exopolysaccharide biosynthesis WecB/TagA/CpsF family protein